jgi:hypothetical protein
MTADAAIGIPEPLWGVLGLAIVDGVVERELAPDAEPVCQADWASHWARRKIHVFPCKPFTGEPLIKDVNDASHLPTLVAAWWTTWPDADIGALPHKSGHFVIVAAGEVGQASLESLTAEVGPLVPEFRHENRWADSHLWFKGRAYTSFNRLGQGLHVFGSGRIIFMPDSQAPNAER